MSSSIIIYPRDPALVVRVKGPLDSVASNELFDGHPELVTITTPIVVDLTRTTYVTSAGLRVLLLLRRRAGTAEQPIALVRGCSQIESTLQKTGFRALFSIVGSVDEAVELVADRPDLTTAWRTSWTSPAR